MNRKQLAGILALLLALAALWMWVQKPRQAPELEAKMVITALPVGKADALIIQESSHVILIDTAEKEDGPYLVQELQNRGIHQIDLLLVTHFDKDHVGGAAYVMEHMEVDSVMMPDYEGDRPEYEDFLAAVQEHPDVRRLTEQTQLAFGELQMAVYPAEDPEEIQNTDGEYDNDMSLVAAVTCGERKFLLTGDIEKTRIAQMLAEDIDWQCDWIKMPHHGRYQKALKELMEAAQPRQAVICCSAEEPAEKKTLKLLRESQIEVWDTSMQTVVTVCDGEQITVRYENEVKKPDI